MSLKASLHFQFLEAFFVGKMLKQIVIDAIPFLAWSGLYY